MNTKYYGSYRGNDEYCEPYITKKEFDEIQSLVRRNNKQNKRYDYIFSGLLKCPLCGSSLAGFTSKTTKCHGKVVEFKYPSYRCNSAYNDKLCSYRKRPVEKTIEKFLLENIENIFQQQVSCGNIGETTENTPTIDINKIKIKLARLTDLYLDGMILREKYDEEFEKLNSILEQSKCVETPKKRDLTKYRNFLETNSLSLYHKLSNKSKCMFWKKYIDYIIQNEDGSFSVTLK